MAWYTDSRIRQRILRRMGHRGLFLISIGMYDVFYGLYLVLGGQLQFQLRVPNTAWGWAWILMGAFLILGGFARRDAVFFAGAVFIKTAWALEFIRLTFISDALQWPRAAYWAWLAVTVIVASAWPEPGRAAEDAVERAGVVRDGGADELG